MQKQVDYIQSQDIELQSVQIEKLDFQSVNEKNKKITPEEKKYIFILSVLFFVQGIPLGFAGALSLLLASNNATMTQQGQHIRNIQATLSMCFLPYSFKLIAAPFLDSIYSDRVGKRRSYVLPTQYLLGFSYILMGFMAFSSLVQDLEVGYLTAICFVIVFLSAIQDIAVDGWVLTCLSKNHVHLGSPCQAIGQNLGSMFGSVLMIHITSLKFTKQIFSDSTSPFLSLNEYCCMIGFMILLITLGVQIFTSEISQKKEDSSHCNQLTTVLNDLLKLLKNKNMKVLILYITLRILPVGPVSASAGIKLIQEGHFPKEVLSSLSMFFFPIKAVTACITAKYLKRGKESQWLYNAFYLTILDSVLQYLIVSNIHHLGDYNNTSLSLVIAEQCFGSIVDTITFCSTGGFFMRISDQNVGGSYLTMLASASNLGYLVSYSVGLYSLEYIPYTPLVFTFWVFGLIFMVLIKDSLFKLQTYLFPF